MEMEAAELDKEKARAAAILSGLGFTPDKQKKPTKFVLYKDCIMKSHM